MPSVRVVYRKYDGSLHWHLWMQQLAEDEHGLWLGAPRDTQLQRGTEPPIVAGPAHLLLLPRETWWTATFNDQPARTEIYCDVTTPVEFGDGEVTMIDLDLDVLRRRDGTVFVDDEDEFAQHQVRYGYPPEVIAAAQSSCDWLTANIVTTEPFASAYKSYLDRVR